jgi:GntR family transcriptional regulator, transcriptional repressor for pyruvate dehydrogenase complex
MLSPKEEWEYLILKALNAAKEPLGSGTISDELRLAGHQTSEATVGRILRDLDGRNLTFRVGFQGRNLTEDGTVRLEELQRERERAFYGSELINVLRARGQDDLIDILLARRVIERETARLAARRATREDLGHLQRIIERHEQNARAGVGGADEDVQFHKLVGQIAGNKVLTAALDLIRQDGQLTPVLEYIRKHVHSTVVDDHKKIWAAIAAGQPEVAEGAMVNHIDNIIADVRKYWAEV